MKPNNRCLTEGPITATLLQLTLPTILGGLSMVIFNITDTYFVGQLGTQQLAALSFTFPVVLFATSVAHGVGIGVSAVVSHAIGEGNRRRVKQVTTDGLGLALLLVIIMATAGLLTMDALFQLLGASPQTMPHIKHYMTIWYGGAVFMVVPMVAFNAIRASGDTKTPGFIVLGAAVVNIVLDPLLIFGIGPFPRLEVAGAAIATVFARAIMMLLSFMVLHCRETMLTYEMPSLRRIRDSWRQILYIGIPTAGTKIALPFAAGVMTSIVATYGSEAVAGFGVATRIEVFALMVILALATVTGPFVGQNYGAGQFDRIKSGLRISYKLSLVWGLATIIILACFGSRIGAFFSRDPEVVSVISLYLFIVPIGYGAYGLLVIATSAMSVLRKPLHAALVTLTQTFMLSLPIAYISARLVGLWGVFLALPLSYIMSGIMARSMLDRIVIYREENSRQASSLHP